MLFLKSLLNRPFTGGDLQRYYAIKYKAWLDKHQHYYYISLLQAPFLLTLLTDGNPMRIALLSNEYPPRIYGGAGVHVDHLSRELVALENGKHYLQILCFGDQKGSSENSMVQGIAPTANFPYQDSRHEKLFDALYRNLAMAGSVKEADLVHCHTWYTHFAGCLLKELFDIPLILTVHSLEPHRPWKEEQLANAYAVTTWLEKTALSNADGVIAVSHSMKEDVQELYGVSPEKIRVIHNGIDLGHYKPTFDKEIIRSYGINPEKPFILFVGRITRQKGIIHLISGIPHLDDDIQIVLCAAVPDTEAIGREMNEKIEEVRGNSKNQIIWISEVVPENHLAILYSHASVFVCPSVYEPFGIINLEAMACNTPVVASAVGGIREVVIHNKTGLLVDFESGDNVQPKRPEQFSRDLAAAINQLLASPEKLKAMGTESRKRVEQHFSWGNIAQQTLEYYREVTDAYRRETRLGV
jgi:starch synthase